MKRPSPRQVLLEFLEEEGGLILGDEWTDGILQALTEAGYAVVPVEPTEAMIDAAAKPLSAPITASNVYRAMIQAPHPPGEK